MWTHFQEQKNFQLVEYYLVLFPVAVSPFFELVEIFFHFDWELLAVPFHFHQAIYSNHFLKILDLVMGIVLVLLYQWKNQNKHLML